MPQFIAVVLAAGKGARFSQEQPKQYSHLAGKPVLARSIEAFERHPSIAAVAVVAHPDYHSLIRGWVREHGWQKVDHILAGGKERSDSTLAALRLFADRDPQTTYLLFHDAARPLVSQSLISRVCEALPAHPVVAVGLPSADTLMQLQGSTVAAIPPRAAMRRMQTPQAFRLDLIAEAYRLAAADPHFQATDDCGVVLRYLPQQPIHVVDGEERNLKLTYPADLEVLERYLSADARAAVPSAAAPAEAGAAANDEPQGRNRYLRAYHSRHLRALQLAQLDILLEIDRLCKRHAIPYWLDSGTLLGAVRHGGFIPWDDDIDICMPLDELPRFAEVARRELPPHLFFQSPATEPEMRLPICKVRNLNSYFVEGADDFSKSYSKGIFVDIFPMEPWPSLPDAVTRRLAKQYCRANAILHAQHTYSLRAVAELFYFGAKRCLNKAAWQLLSLLTDKKKYYSNTLDNSGNGNRHLRATIFPLTTISFEGHAFSAPADADRYLRDLFGDYMQLPPPDQRISHATFFSVRLT